MKTRKLLAGLLVRVMIVALTGYTARDDAADDAEPEAPEEEALPEEPVPALRVDYAKEVSEELTRQLGRRVRLTEGKRTGKIELEYYGADDREVLIEALRKIQGGK